jgi:hypothetical protein
MPFPRWFIVEEAHEVCGNGSMHTDVNTILRYSRHNFLGVIFSSQRIADVDKLLTSSARIVILFHTQEFRDVEAARLRWGPQVSKALENLRPCIYNDASGECEQEPECIILRKGFGFRVVSLGDKVKVVQQSETEDTALWQDDQELEEQQTPEVSYLEQGSGNPD